MAMTESKDIQEDRPKIIYKTKDEDKGKKLESKYSSFICANQKGLQFCAWILLTVGVCIVFITFYMARLQYSNKVLKSHNNRGVMQNEATVRSDFKELHFEVNGRNLDEIGRFSASNKSGKTENYVNSCKENLCEIACENVENIYKALNDTIKHSLCPFINTLILKKQAFHLGVLKNDWLLPYNISFERVIIYLNNITTIESSAFNSPLFKNAFSIALYSMNISNVESGALLGLYRLKYLTIKCRINKFEPSILQPVQTSLVKFKLNAFLKIEGNRNFFGASYLNKLTYLDLSNNIFNGPLGKHLFQSTTNLRHLILIESLIQYIEEDAFEYLAQTLLFVNLSKNRLTTLSSAVFQPILVSQRIFMINLTNNKWICDCQLQEMADLYRLYHLQFIDGVFCKTPNNLHGVALDEVDFRQENCSDSKTTAENKQEFSTSEPGIISSETITSKAHQNIDSKIDLANSYQVSSSVVADKFRMRCLDSQTRKSSNADREYLQFPAATLNFQLELIAENNTVVVSIDNSAETFVIWFSEHLESFVASYSNTSFDYECVRYSVPDLVVGPLQEDTTYTFCLIPALQNAISPFNCLPLYVPAKNVHHKHVWISEDNKPFTIGMLCLIFLLSAIAGAFIAYFGTKTYPDLLEGSKNVLVAKKHDKVCYVATISETEYQNRASLKNRKSFINKLPLHETPSAETPPTPSFMSVKDLEKLSSVKSCSTNSEDVVRSYKFTNDEYETPKECINEYTVEQRGIVNKYGTTPRSPPPLPKRNSNVTNI